MNRYVQRTALSGANRLVANHERMYKADGSKTGIIAFHGASNDYSAFFNDFYRGFVPTGLPMVGGDMGGPLTWGSDTALSAADTAYGWLTNQAEIGAKPGEVIVWGGSMGSLGALNWARAQPAGRVKALVAVLPIIDLDAVYQANPNGYRASIGTAYGVTHPTALPGLATHSPILYGTDLDFPIMLVTSDTDNIGYTTAQAEVWAAAVGSNVSVHSLGAIGHNVYSVLPELPFIMEHASGL